VLRDSAWRALSNSSGCRGLPGPSPGGLVVPERRRPRLGRPSESRSFHASRVTPPGVMSSPATSPAQYPARSTVRQWRAPSWAAASPSSSAIRSGRHERACPKATGSLPSRTIFDTLARPVARPVRDSPKSSGALAPDEDQHAPAHLRRECSPPGKAGVWEEGFVGAREFASNLRPSRHGPGRRRDAVASALRRPAVWPQLAHGDL
jgi:hypothetical protein